MFTPMRLLTAMAAMSCIAMISGCVTGGATADAYPKYESKGAGVYPEGSVVAKNGKLRVKRADLTNESGERILLKGLSSHDLKKFGSFANSECVEFLAKDWNVTVLRAALYVGSFEEDPTIERYLDEMVDSCEKAGIYCIIDWHILYEKNPSSRTEEAKAFFARKAQQYADKDHVIYEICNEPNGDDVNWAKDVKPYAEAVIPVIRKYDPDSVVIVGTPTWSQDVDRAAKSPLSFFNVMYAFHFYAGTHGQDIKTKLRGAFNRVPVFCTEWGTTNANGDGGPFVAESNAWLGMIESMGISWCNWSLSDANEASAILKSGANPKGGWTDADLTPNGLYVRECMRK